MLLFYFVLLLEPHLHGILL